MFNPQDWYWAVGGSTSQVYSSARNTYVSVSDASYIEWQAAHGGNAAPIAAEAEIWPYVSGPPLLRPAWMFNGTVFAQPTTTTYTKTQLKAYAANKRWLKEVGGITVSGIPVLTDDRSKTMITGGRVAANADGAWTTTWVGGDNNTYPINAAAMIAISNAVQDHVSTCFEQYATVVDAIDGNTTTTLAQIDTAFA